MPPHPTEQLAAFLACYDPAMAALGARILERMRTRLPGAVELVYDNYNALVVGFGPTERTSDAPFSIALYPRWVTLFFLRGAELPDPMAILRGEGKIVRHLVLDDPARLDDPDVEALIAAALARSPRPFDPTGPGRIVIKSVSPTQRSRRPRGG